MLPYIAMIFFFMCLLAYCVSDLWLYKRKEKDRFIRDEIVEILRPRVNALYILNDKIYIIADHHCDEVYEAIAWVESRSRAAKFDYFDFQVIAQKKRLLNDILSSGMIPYSAKPLFINGSVK